MVSYGARRGLSPGDSNSPMTGLVPEVTLMMIRQPPRPGLTPVAACVPGTVYKPFTDTPSCRPTTTLCGGRSHRPSFTERNTRSQKAPCFSAGHAARTDPEVPRPRSNTAERQRGSSDPSNPKATRSATLLRVARISSREVRPAGGGGTTLGEGPPSALGPRGQLAVLGRSH